MAEKLQFRNIGEFPEYWHKLMRAEACRVKESLFLKDAEVFVPQVAAPLDPQESCGP